MSELNGLLKQRNGFLTDECIWEIRNTDNCGRGLYATREINTGEIILKDVPLVLGPRVTGIQLVSCVVCFNFKTTLRKCSKNCHLPVCGEKCENSPKHEKECEYFRKIISIEDSWSFDLYKDLGPLRCLFLDENDQTIIKMLHSNSKESVQKQVDKIKILLGDFLNKKDQEWIQYCCGVLNGNAFDINLSHISLRGLYPLAAIMNHDCSPNTRHFYSKDNPLMMSVVASKEIKKDEEITNHYCPLLWATKTRRIFLYATKEFLCNCTRCQDPTEFETYLSALMCNCGGPILPKSPLELTSSLKCRDCSQIISSRDAHQILANFQKLPEELLSIIHPNNAVMVERKMDMLKNLGNNIANLKVEELDIKEKTEKEIIEIIKKLKLGETNLKGILLHSLYKTLDQKQKRNIKINKKEFENLYQNAKIILENDYSAPKFD